MRDKAVKNILKDADVKFLRFLWCDNANVIRAKAAHINYLSEYMENGFGISVAQMGLPVTGRMSPSVPGR